VGVISRRRLTGLLPDPGPARVLAVATLVNTIGNGLFLTVSVLFFTRSVGLSAAEVGLGLTLAAGVGLLAGVPMGHVADRRGPREILLSLLLVQAVATTLYVFVQSFAAFLAVACLATAADRAATAVRGAVIFAIAGPEGRVRTRAYLRAVVNVGISIGTVFAGIGLAYDTRTAYVLLVLADAVTFALAALIIRKLPYIPPAVVPAAMASGPRLVALRDRPFLAITALNAVLAVHYGLLEIAVPLWVVERTEAPRWIVAVLFGINTAAVVLLQVRVSRGTERIEAAARAQRLSGVLLAAACLLYATSSGRSSGVAIALLVAAAVVHVGGELWQAAGGWGLAFGLAPAYAQGQYQGVFSTGFSVSSMLAPVVVVTLTVGIGAAGWAALAAVFLLVGGIAPPVARWAERRSAALVPGAAPG